MLRICCADAAFTDTTLRAHAVAAFLSDGLLDIPVQVEQEQ